MRVAGVAHCGRHCISDASNPVPPADAKMHDYAAWVDVCEWVAENTPPDAVFLTPRIGARPSNGGPAGRKSPPTRTFPKTPATWSNGLNDCDTFTTWSSAASPSRSLRWAHWARSARSNLARQYGADYILSDQRVPLALRAVYPNRSTRTTSMWCMSSKIETLMTAADLPERLAAELSRGRVSPRRDSESTSLGETRPRASRDGRRFAPELSYGRHFGPAPSTARPAAVIALLVRRAGRWHIPLTVRQAALGRHGGQISLPGGAVEPGESTAQAAERELAEELGVREPVELRRPAQRLLRVRQRFSRHAVARRDDARTRLAAAHPRSRTRRRNAARRPASIRIVSARRRSSAGR